MPNGTSQTAPGGGSAERLVHRGSIERRQTESARPSTRSATQRDQQPLDAAGDASRRSTPDAARRRQHGERHEDADDRASGHSGVGDKRHVAQQDRRQLQSGVEAADRQESVRAPRSRTPCATMRQTRSSSRCRSRAHQARRRSAAAGTMPSQPTASMRSRPAATRTLGPRRQSADAAAGRAAARADRRRAGRCATGTPA